MTEKEQLIEIIRKHFNDLISRQMYVDWVENGDCMKTKSGELADAILEWHSQEIMKIQLCPNNKCNRGKVLSPDGDSAVVDCPVCEGKGWYVSQ